MKMNRRQFVKSLTKSAIAAPLLNLPWARSVFAQQAPKRVIFMYVPDGCIPNRFHPTGSEFSFTLPDQTNPLQPVVQHCVFPAGLTMYEGSAGHAGTDKLLTGDSFNSTQSLDYFLGQQLGANTPFKSLHLGVAATFQAGDNNAISFQPGRIPISANDNPLNAFANIFAGVTGGGNATVEQQRQGSVLDACLADLNRLQSNLNGAEAAKLQQHAEAIFEVEQRLQNASSGGSCNTSGFNPTGFQITGPEWAYPAVVHLEQHFGTIADMQIDIIVRAMACNMAPVATIGFSHPVSPTHVEGLAQGNHDVSHYGNLGSDAANVFSQYKRYFVRQFMNLINRLNSQTDVDGNTMLFNSLILLCSEQGDSNLHNSENMPFILAGHAGGALQTGRYLNFNGDAHSKLLVSIANLVGVNINSFGYTGHGMGGLPGL